MSGQPAPSLPTETRAKRHKVFLPAELSGAGETLRVHLLNISPTGALVHGDAPPLPGAAVRVRCAGASWAARVVWVQGKRFGIMNQTALTAAQTAALVAGHAG